MINWSLINTLMSDGVCVDRGETVVHQHQHGTLVGRMVNQQGADNTDQRLREIHFRKSEKSNLQDEVLQICVHRKSKTCSSRKPHIEYSSLPPSA